MSIRNDRQNQVWYDAHINSIRKSENWGSMFIQIPTINSVTPLD